MFFMENIIFIEIEINREDIAKRKVRENKEGKRRGGPVGVPADKDL